MQKFSHVVIENVMSAVPQNSKRQKERDPNPARAQGGPRRERKERRERREREERRGGRGGGQALTRPLFSRRKSVQLAVRVR